MLEWSNGSDIGTDPDLPLPNKPLVSMDATNHGTNQQRFVDTHSTTECSVEVMIIWSIPHPYLSFHSTVLLHDSAVCGYCAHYCCCLLLPIITIIFSSQDGGWLPMWRVKTKSKTNKTTTTTKTATHAVVDCIRCSGQCPVVYYIAWVLPPPSPSVCLGEATKSLLLLLLIL